MKRAFRVASSILLIFCLAPSSFGEEFDPTASIASVLERQRRLQTLVVEYEQIKSYTPKVRHPPRQIDDPISKIPMREVMIEGTSKHKCLFRYLDRQLRYECELIGGDGTAAEGMKREVSVFSRKRVERLWRQPQESRDLGSIHAEHPLPDDPIVDFMLGLRAEDNHGWLRYEDWKKVSVRQRGDFVDLERPEPKRHCVHVWSADPEKGYAFVQYRLIYKGRVSKEAVADDFREIDGLQLPYSIEWREYGPDGPDAGPVQSAKLRIDRYQIDAPDNTAERFVIEWPNKSVVLDTRSGAQIVIRDGPRVLDEEYLKSRPPNRIPSKRAPARTQPAR